MDYNATIMDRTDVAPGLMILRVALDDQDFPFEAGQYTVLGLKQNAPRVDGAAPEEFDPGKQPPPERLVRRAYSIASSSEPGEYLEFYITLVSGGALTPRLFHLKRDDRIHVGRKATGIFTLDRVPEQYGVLLAGTGTGLAPYMSMLRSEFVCGTRRTFVVMHGARYSSDLGYRSELETLARHCLNFYYLPSISRPKEDPSWAGLTGYLQDQILSDAVEKKCGIAVHPNNFHIFLCGNPGMIDAAKKGLVEIGYVADKGREVGNLHLEEYW